MSPPARLLVLRFGSAGDVVLTAPALQALKRAWPSCEILYAVKRAFAPLIENNPHVGRVVALESGESVFHFWRRLRAIDCDAVLDLHDKLRSKLLRLLLPRRGPRAVWHKRDWTLELPVRLGLTPYDAGMLLADRYHRAVESLVGTALPRGELRYWVGAEQQAEADALLAAVGVQRGRPLVGMAPGANWGTKQWPLERFAALAERAAAFGAQVAVTGSEAERPLATAIRQRVPRAIDLCGTVSLAALGGFIARCTAFVGNDSGPMHIARALGVPTLAFFGSTDPRQFDFTGHRVLFAGVPCSPCHFYGRKRCPRGHFDCMKKIEVDDAWRALEDLLRAGRRLPVSA